eukprot:jgi/Mesvir1/19394/Mv10428-RA.1
MGDRLANLRFALQALHKNGVQVLSHSSLYESDPMYLTDQPQFLNAVVAAATCHPPRQLIAALKEIEAMCGRKGGGVRNGPRPLDLDILFYGSERVDVDDERLPLHIPHARMMERGFVMFPLQDLLDDGGATSQGEHGAGELPSEQAAQGQQVPAQHSWRRVGQAMVDAWRQQQKSTGADGLSLHGLRRVMPLRSQLWEWGARTHVMGVLNITPDSFSDGGVHSDPSAAVAEAVRMVEAGVDFLDVGGQSTRPGAHLLTAAEECRRVVPVIHALASHDVTKGTPISVDTFYAQVAREAVAAGASIVNDVSAGTIDPTMIEAVADHPNIAYVMMHLRGTPETMQDASNTMYRDVCRDTAGELSARVCEAMLAGVEGWRIWSDPGFGFAKTKDQNVQLLRGLDVFRRCLLPGTLRNAPLLIGVSRKGFLGALTGRKGPRDRDWATVAAMVAGTRAGADVIRAHNVVAAKDAVAVADALWRHGSPEL